ncbi:MAG: VOC family protein [Pseudomonadota bacterium]
MTPLYKAPNAACIGHIHLKVSDLDRALAFYRDLLGFEVMARFPEAAFLGAGGYHHHIALNTWHSKGRAPAPQNAAGLYHVAILYPTLADLSYIYKRLTDHGLTLDGYADHGVSLALYLRDPDNNGVELYWDRPKDQWPMTEDGGIAMKNDRFDLDQVLGV